MQYLGGKSKIRFDVRNLLVSLIGNKKSYVEPFVGGGWILQEMANLKLNRVASDVNPALIAMYKALQDGWIPPDFVSEEEWRKYRQMKDAIPDPMMAFARFGCGFGGDWNGGYARSEDKDCYAATSKRSLLEQLPAIMDVEFRCCSYSEHKPIDSLVYCDPPYLGTTGYAATGGFDHAVFWETMRKWSENNVVVISEYTSPEDFVKVRIFESRMGLDSGKSGNREVREDCCFMHESIADLAKVSKNDAFDDCW